MRINTVAAVVTILALTATACGSESGGDRAEMVGGKGLDVCSLVSDKTVADLQSAADTESEPVEDIWDDAETFIQCTVVTDVKVRFAVRAVAGGPPAESLVEGKYDAPSEPLGGVGDSAVVGINSYDGVRIAATVDGHDVIVDSEFADGGDRVTRDDVIALAKEVVSNLGDEMPAAIRLPKACPQPPDAKVDEMVGEVTIARGTVADNGSVGCSYVGSDRLMRLTAAVGDSSFNLMAQADSDPNDRVEVDGSPGLFDDNELVVFEGDDDCVLGASVGPFDLGRADQRPESEVRDEAIDLVRYVKEEIGCPS